MIWLKSVAATPRRRKSGCVRIDFSSPARWPRSFRAPIPAILSLCHAVQTLTFGAESPAKSSANTLLGGEWACIPSRCRRRRSRTSLVDKSSSRMLNRSADRRSICPALIQLTLPKFTTRNGWRLHGGHLTATNDGLQTHSGRTRRSPANVGNRKICHSREVSSVSGRHSGLRQRPCSSPQSNWRYFQSTVASISCSALDGGVCV
jgi:hypothetical protein